MKKSTLICGIAFLLTASTYHSNAQNWLLNGNAGISSTAFLGTTDAKTLKFKTNNTTRMVITSGGKIGMGIAAPISVLDIVGKTTTVDPIVNITGKYVGPLDVIGLNVTSLPSDTGGIGLVANANFIGMRGFGNGFGVVGEGAIGVYGYSAFQPGVLADPTGVWAETENGNLGNAIFGFSQTATQNISIWGIAADTSTATAPVDFAGYFQGNVLAWRYYTPSDARLKSNIKPLSSVLAKLNKLETATYNFRTSEYPNLYLPSDLQTGFMASNLQEQFPNLVQDITVPEKIHPKTGKLISQAASLKVVNYMGMVPVLTAAIQEQQVQIESRDAVIEKLQSQLSALATKIAAIESAMDNSSSAERISNSSEAFLDQNAPNPFNQTTTIKYFLPESYKNARLTITSMNGAIVSDYVLKGKGNGLVTLNANEFAAGNYSYSLIIDGSVVSTKSLVLTK